MDPRPPLFSVPEQGQLVQVRNRLFAVVDVAASSLATSVMDQAASPTHLLTLASIEDGALGEELQVIWEIEPHKRIFDDGALPAPAGFDPPVHFDGFLNAVRWGAAVTADGRMIQAPFRSGIEIEDYQLDPVVRAVQMPRANLLIADDVGLGKTIEAGLVVQELIIRQRVRTVLIVCPASLQIHWRDQMREKFGLEFRIVNSDLMRELRRSRGIHVNPWSHFPRLITSIDYLKRDHPMRLMREVLPAPGESIYPRRFDLLIVDEAHNVAPSGRGHYAIDSLRTKAIRTIATHFEHKLFLTATPHNGYTESFSALLELLDNQRFARGLPPDPETLAQVMVRRLKNDLPPDDLGRPRFPARKLAAIEVAYTEEERNAHRFLQRYIQLRRQHAQHDPLARTANEFVLRLLKKRLFSSPAAFAKTLEQHRNTLERDTTIKQKATTARLPVGILRARLESYEEETDDDAAPEEVVATALQMAGRHATPLTESERTLLRQLEQWAQDAALRADSKAQQLMNWLHAHIKPDGQWSNERVIIFTEYRDSQNWLQTLLAARDFTSNERLMVLHGGLNSEERERIKAAFQAAPEVSPVRILLATDAASEGIDLQRHCHRLIHYEIPWNPNRLEQRNGRIDRHGQRHNPLIYHFAPAGYSNRAGRSRDDLGELSASDQYEPAASLDDLDWDQEFLMLVVRKVNQIREDLGRVGQVIADQIVEAMQGDRRILQTTNAELAAAPERRLLQFERDLAARIDRLHQQLFETKRALALEPQNVQTVVEVALRLAGQPPLIEARLDGIWPDPTGRRRRCPVFHVPALIGPSWARCAEGLAHPHTGAMRPIVFDHNLARGRDDVVLAHLNHRLVQMSLRLLRAQVWSQEGSNRLHRVVARIVPDRALQHPAVIAYGRLVVIGGDSQRLHEEIIHAGGEIRQQHFRRFDSLTQMNDVLNAATQDEPGSEVKQRLAAMWPAVEMPLMRSLDVRMQERVENLDSILNRRMEKELGDIRAILSELERSIRSEISSVPAQLPLFYSQDERQQYQLNVEALEARLSQIPGELEQEEALIRQRYVEPKPRLFPVAVMFLVPESMAA